MYTADYHGDDFALSKNNSQRMLELIEAGKMDSISIISNMGCFSECMSLLRDRWGSLETKEEREMFLEDLSKIESKYEFELDDSQKSAIEKGINNGIFLLTGGPGTGKTTIIKALIEFFYNAGTKQLLLKFAKLTLV